MSDTYTYEEIANSYALWIEYVDPYGSTTEEEFDSMTEEQKISMQVDLFGEEDDDEDACRYFEKNGLTVCVNLEQASSNVFYSLDTYRDEGKFHATVFQTADVRDEEDAWNKVNSWLDDQASN